MTDEELAEAVIGGFTGEDRCARCSEFSINWPFRMRDRRSFLLQLCAGCFRVIKHKANAALDDSVKKALITSAQNGFWSWGNTDYLNSSTFTAECRKGAK